MVTTKRKFDLGNVAILDDDQMGGKLLEEMLSHVGAKFWKPRDLRDFISMYSMGSCTGIFKYIVINLDMVGYDFPKILEDLQLAKQQSEGFEKAIFIGLTSERDKIKQMETGKLKADKIVLKPFSIRDISKVLC